MRTNIIQVKLVFNNFKHRLIYILKKNSTVTYIYIYIYKLSRALLPIRHSLVPKRRKVEVRYKVCGH